MFHILKKIFAKYLTLVFVIFIFVSYTKYEDYLVIL